MKSGLGLSRNGAIARAMNIRWGIILLSILLFLGSTSYAAITVTVTGPGGSASQSVPDDGGDFDVHLPLNRNAVNNIVVTAEDAGGNSVSATLAVTQVSLDQIVVSKVTSERLSVEEVQQLVTDGVIDLENPENYNVSTFDIVLTIDKAPVTVSVPVVVPIKLNEETGYETYKRPPGGDSGGNAPRTPQIQIVVFQQSVASEGGEANNMTIPGVIIIEGNIRSLKEFFSVRLLLMNTSGIFTLTDVTAEIELPEGTLSSILPADGINRFGEILPGDGDTPGQKEMEFIIRGDEIGVHDVTVNFGGTVTGPGIGDAIAFNGSAVTEVEVKGPPTFLVEVTHPDTVESGVPYEMIVDITNTGELTAMYASLELDVGADAMLAKCKLDDTGEPDCEYDTGSEIRSFGHIEPGETVRETFMVVPLVNGKISSCVAAADQNITLNVYMGSQGCMVGHYPPKVNVGDGVPTVTVVPAPNTTGVHEDAAVTAFFSEIMNENSITTGENGDFNVYDSSGERVTGELRFTTLFRNTENEKTVAIWQVNNGVTNRLQSNAEYTVVITTDIVDLNGNALSNRWESTFTTTDTGLNDTTAPTVSMSVAPPVSPNTILPGQIININAYAADAGSGISRVELRLKDLDKVGGVYELVGQKTVYQGDRPPFIFAVDSGKLTPGHTVQAQATAYDGMGNAQSTTLALVLLESADPPTVTLPDDPVNPVLQGISISLTPVLTGGVRRVEYYLDGVSLPYKTVSLSPFKAILSTLALSMGDHAITVTAVDGLGQTGSAQYRFTLAENLNMPVVGFSNVVDGAVYEAGASILIVGTAEDPVGIERITYWLDSTVSAPLYSGFSSIRLNTSGIETGAHVVYIQAENVLGIESDLAMAAAAFEFTLVDPPPGLPPASPDISIGFSEDGLVTCTGSTVAGARVVITNTNMGISATVYANSSGNFTGQVPGEEGNDISVVAYDLTASTDPSVAAFGVIPASPVLTAISVSPAAMVFDTAGAWQDIAVTGHYESGDSTDLTGVATFTTSDASVATVSTSGRVVARSYGDAVVTAMVEGFSALTAVDVNIVTLTGIEVSPNPVSMIFIGETENLTVKGIYSDGSEAVFSTGLTYATGNPAVATVNASGVVTATGNGETQINVAHSGVAPISVTVGVDLGLDPGPILEILSPVNGNSVERDGTISVIVRAEDALGGLERLYMEATGEAEAFETIQIQPVPEDQSETRSFSLQIPGDAGIGGTITIRVWAEDTGGNLSTEEAITLTVVDEKGPSVTITAPGQLAPYNFGDTVLVAVSAQDSGGLSEIRYETEGALIFSGSSDLTGELNVTTNFTFDIPYNTTSERVTITAYATDLNGNEEASIPVDIIITDADITPPSTEVMAVSDPAGESGAIVSYAVTDGLSDLNYVALYFRKDSIGTFNRYTGPDGTGDGKYFPESGGTGTVFFDATRMGGDGNYEFYTVGFDVAGNRESAPTDGTGGVVADDAVAFAAGTVWEEITTSVLISEGENTYDDQNLRISGSGVIVMLDGFHDFHNVEVINGAVLTHLETDTSRAYGLKFSAWTLTVDGTSCIDAKGRGYVGGTGHNESGRTLDNAYGSSHHAGGSHGGLGGTYGGVPGVLYNDLTNPEAPGSGGGADGYTDGGDGGGIIVIDAVNIVADGDIQSNGEESDGGAAGDGSGGSVHIICRTVSGTGAIAADAGGADIGVGGGGGRVAIDYLDMATKDQNLITAMGGIGNYGSGANGTVYLKKETVPNGQIVITGQGDGSAWTQLSIPEGYIFDTVTLQNSARVLADEGVVITGRLLVTGDSVLSHSNGNEAGLVIEASVVQVDEGSSIDVTGRGYGGGTGHDESGRTLNTAYGSSHHAGGSYGGIGAGYNFAGAGLGYGDPREPDELGSGGGADGYTDGGRGGGRVTILATDALVVNGAIRADGGESAGGSAGDGSGGAIWITTHRLAGAGRIGADGGGNESGTAGGGGRVAIYCDYVDLEDDFGNLYDITAFGGRGGDDTRAASAGTVFIQYDGQDNGNLYIDDNYSGVTAPESTELPHMGFGIIAGVTEDTLTTDGLVTLLAGGLAGLRINPDITQTETFEILSNTSGGITVVTPNENNVAFADVAQVGDAYAGSYRYDSVTFRRGGNLKTGDLLTVEGMMRIDEHGLLTHFDATTAFVSRLDLTVGDLYIAETGRIDVTGRGYVGGTGHNESGRTLNNAYGSSHHAGGSYGGLGGGYSGGISSETYGSETNPENLGSGGGADGYTDGGDGGGRIFITALDMTVDGAIRADGEPGVGGSAGNGSGGTVNIDTGVLDGSGTIEADGGGDTCVGGGGGRIAIRYRDDMSLSEAHVQALGGDGNYVDGGGNGTVFIKRPGQEYGDLVVDGLGYATSFDKTFLDGGYIYDNVILRNSARVLADEGVVITGRLLVTGDSVLSHSNGNEAGLVIEASVVQVDEGSSIDVTGRGYGGGTGHDESGRTLNTAYGSSHHAGGSYGGIGAGYNFAGAGLGYGDPREPDELGSGGGADGYTDGGRGGGRVTILATDALVVNGAIRADGGESAGGSAGDGSGGAIWITTHRLAGAGRIGADGGGNESGTAGGGGRVAIYCDYVDLEDDFGNLYDITAFGGRGGDDTRAASAGTVFIQYDGQDNGNLYIDDNYSGVTAPESTELPHMGFGIIAGVTEDTLTTDGLVTLLAGGLAGLRINPDITQTETFEILSNTSGGITVVTPNENNVAFADVAQVGDAYAGSYRYDSVTFRRGGNLKTGDLLTVEGTMRIDEHGLLTHFDATTAFVSRLDLTVGDLYIAETGRIDVTGRGYVGGTGHNESGRTLNNAYGSSHHAGGSYGGLGGGGYSCGISSETYGSETNPENLGSGGGADGYTDGGDGGGQIFITALDMTVDGAIRADGEPGVGGSAGNGSGGTVNIDTGVLDGSGTIEADGGGDTGVGGGGGRIAIRVGDLEHWEGTVQSLGGVGQYGTAGEDGSVVYP